MALPQKTKKQLSYSQEKRVAKALTGKPQVGSGNKWFAKGDVKSQECLVEAKATSKQSISVEAKVWRKIEGEALKENKIPALALELKDNRGNTINLIAMDITDIQERFQ